MKKRILAVILALGIILSFAGCNVDELSFYETIKNITKLTDFTFEGSTALIINTLETPNTTDSKSQEEIASIKAMFEGKSLVYNGSISKANNKIVLNISIKDASNTPMNILKLIIDNDKLLISKDVATGLRLSNGTEVTIDETVYTKYVLTDLVTQLTDELTSQIVIGKPASSPYTWTPKPSDDYFDGYNDGVAAGIEAGYANQNKPEPTPTGNQEYDNGYKAGNDAGYMSGKIAFDNSEEKPDATKFEPYYQPDPSQEFLDGYNQGMLDGIDDGYGGLESSLEENNGTTDYDDGYWYGYMSGYQNGKSQYEYETMAIPQIAHLKTFLMDHTNANKIIDTFKSINTKVMDEMIKGMFSGMEFGLIKKDGYNKFVMNANQDQMIDSYVNLFSYLISNKEVILTSLEKIITDIANDELAVFELDPSTIQSIVRIIDRIWLLDAQDIETEKADMIQGAESLKAAMKDKITANCNFVIEKTGSDSYEMNNCFKIVSAAFEEFPVNADIELKSSLSINKPLCGTTEIKENGCQPTVGGAKINIGVTDENAVECGIVISNSNDFSNPKFITATKQNDGSMLADLSSLSDDTTYYYKSYTKDNAGNYIFTEISSFKTLKAANPKTADRFNFTFAIFAMCISLFFIVLIALKRKNKAII